MKDNVPCSQKEIEPELVDFLSALPKLVLNIWAIFLCFVLLNYVYFIGGGHGGECYRNKFINNQ